MVYCFCKIPYIYWVGYGREKTLARSQKSVAETTIKHLVERGSCACVGNILSRGVPVDFKLKIFSITTMLYTYATSLGNGILFILWP